MHPANDGESRALSRVLSRCSALLLISACAVAGCSSDVTNPSGAEAFQLVSYGTQPLPVALSRTSGVGGGASVPDCTTFLTGMELSMLADGGVTRAEFRRTDCNNGTSSNATSVNSGKLTSSASDVRIEFAASATTGVERYVGHRTATQIVIETRELETPMVSPSGGSGTLLSRDDTPLVFERRP